jgi:hypothetical protein
VALPAVSDPAWTKNPDRLFHSRQAGHGETEAVGGSAARDSPAPCFTRHYRSAAHARTDCGVPCRQERRCVRPRRRPPARIAALASVGAATGLDLARYADSDGYTIDAPREIWKYRDWVIKAINDDQPFDKFVIDQYAGDLLPNPTDDQLVATGFHRNTPSNYEGGIDFEQYRVEAVADRVATTGAVFLGLTTGCARCHDHKYDPISQREFYELFAFLNNVDEVDKAADRNRFNKPFLESGKPDDIPKQAANTAQLRLLDGELENYRLTLASLSEEDKKKDVGLIEAPKRHSHFAWPRSQGRQHDDHASSSPAHPIYTSVATSCARARPSSPALGVLNPLPPPVNGKRRNRLDLANWMVDRSNPLTARVTVNRMWQRYFGKGIVETTATSARRAISLPIWSCSIGLPSNSWIAAGARRRCTG